MARTNKLIPQPAWIKDIIHKKGDTKDIISVILRAVNYNHRQAIREMDNVAEALIGKNDLETCYNVWLFVRENIQYKEDKTGKELLKLPSALYHSGFGDCKSFSLMILSILAHYPSIEPGFRFVGYEGHTDYRHVYVIAKINDGNRKIIIDGTYEKFNEEPPYIFKKDYWMTEIAMLRGPQVAQIKKAIPTISEAFADGPRRAINPQSIDIAKFSQGELTLELLKNSLLIQSNYYGDVNGYFSKAIFIIDEAKRKGLSNWQAPTGSIDPIFNEILYTIQSSKKRHIQQVTLLSEGLSDYTGISERYNPGLDYEALKKCIVNAKPEKADWWYRNFSTKAYIESDGESYKLNSALEECIRQQLLIQWAKKNIFESEGFRKGSHSLLYEFIDDSSSYYQLNTEGLVKKVFHKSYVDAFNIISGLDRENVRLYVNNGIQATSAANQVVGISPEFNIRGLSDAVKFGINVEPITTTAAVIKIIGMISTAIIAFTSVLKTITPQVRLGDLVKAPYGDSSKPQKEDFLRNKIEEAQSLGMVIPLVAGAAGIYFLSSNKRNK